MRARISGSGAACALAGLTLSCASGPVTLVGYQVPARQQVAIVIDISDQVNDADQSGGIATLADTITDGLKEHGIDSQLYTSKYDHPKPPRVDVFVSSWHGAAAKAHAVAGTTGAALVVAPVAGIVAAPVALAASYNDIVLDCRVTLPGQAKPAFARHFESSGFISNYSENSGNGAAESAGNAIVHAILKH